MSLKYSYDGAGNLTTIRDYGVTPDPSSDQISTSLIPGYSSPTYNKSGEATLFNGNTLQYDPFGELTTLSGQTTNMSTGTVSTYTDAMVYDHVGRRASLLESLGMSVAVVHLPSKGIGMVSNRTDEQFFVYDVGDLSYRQIPGNGTVPTTALNQPDFQTADNGVLYLYGPTGLVMEFDRFGYNSRTLLFDPQGSFVSSSNGTYVPQGNGTMEGTSAFPAFYDAYGLPVWAPPAPISNTIPAPLNLATSQPFQYKGQFGYYTDGASGLIYCQHRYYDPNTGRWTERDPTGLGGGVNVYQYVNGNPVTGIDPRGTDDYAIICGDSGNDARFMRPYYTARAWNLSTNGDDTVIAEDNPDRVRMLEIFTSKLDYMEFWGHGNSKGLWFGRDKGAYLTVNQIRGVAAVRRSMGLRKLKYIRIDECCVCANHSMVNALLELTDEVYGYEGETIDADNKTYSLGVIRCYTMPFKRSPGLAKGQDDIADEYDPKNYRKWIFTRDPIPRKGHTK